MEIAGEIDNIRAAWRWAVDQEQTALLEPVVEPLFRFYEMRGWFREGAETFARAAASPWARGAERPVAIVGRPWRSSAS